MFSSQESIKLVIIMMCSLISYHSLIIDLFHLPYSQAIINVIKITHAKDVRSLNHDKALQSIRLCFEAIVTSLENVVQERSVVHGVVYLCSNVQFSCICPNDRPYITFLRCLDVKPLSLTLS